MRQYPFIFSNESKYRLQRHLVFWFTWWVFCTILYSYAPVNQFGTPLFKRFQLSAVDAFFYMIAHMFLAYTLMYLVVPRILLKGNYWTAAFSTAVLLLATAMISSVIGMYILNPTWKYLLVNPAPKAEHLSTMRFFNGLLGGLRGAITIGGFAVAIKLMKYWYVKEQRNLELEKQNIASQLQLLKAQVHPHFLFNTLNNIYSFSQANSPQAPKLIAGLSDLLRYMLYECNQPLVPLSKELKMISDYIMLEQVRYNHQLDLSMELPEADGNLLIAPLLLLPLVENCFKHGTSQVVDQPWVSLSASTSGVDFRMKLVNSKAGRNNRSESGIGIKNVRKRLELSYPGRHQLRITESEDTFIVSLNLQLEKKTGQVLTRQKLSYA